MDANCVDVFSAAYKDAVRLFPNSEELLKAPRWRQAAARTQAIIEGTPPGVVGQVANQRHIVQEALSRITRQELHDNVKKLDRMLYRELPKMTYIGPTKYASIARQYPDKVFMEYPQYFSGASPKLQQAFRRSEAFNTQKIKLAKALGYPIDEIVGRSYFEHIWEDVDSALTGRVQSVPPGRVSVAKTREFDDYIQGIAAGRKPAEMTVGEVIEHSSELMDKALADAYERRLILERFGTKTKTADLREFNAPLYKGWYGKPEIVNFVDQLQSPAPAAMTPINELSAALKNTVFGPADIGVFGVHVLRGVTTGGPQMVAAVINRGLAALGLPHFDLWLANNLTKAMQANVRGGVHIGQGPSAITLGGGTIVKYIPFVGRLLDKPISGGVDALARIQFGGILTPIRVMRYEGDLIMLRLLGRDINNPRILRQAGDWANVSTGASRGAMTQGRRSVETATFTSFQMVRAEAAQWLKLATAVANPRTSAVERMLGLTALASLGAMVYGLGSAINMSFGSGKPIEWNPAKTDWATVELKGLKIPLIPQRALIRAIGKSYDALSKEDPERLTQIWTQYAVGKLSPLVGGLAAGAGFGFDRERGFRVGDLSPEARLRGLAPMPPIVETALDPDERSAAGLALSYVGLNPWPVPLNERKSRAIADLYDKGAFIDDYSHLPNGEPERFGQLSNTDKQIAAKQYPNLFSEEAMDKAGGKADVSQRDQNDISAGKLDAATAARDTAIERTLKEAQTDRFGDISERETRVTLLDHLADAANDWGAVLENELTTNPGFFGEEDNPAKLKYRALNDKYPFPRTSEEWDAFDAEYEREFSDEQKSFLEREAGVKRNATQNKLRAVKERTSPYYDFLDTLSEDDKKADEKKETWRQQNPEVDAALWVLGSVGIVRSARARKLAAEYMNELYGTDIESSDVAVPATPVPAKRKPSSGKIKKAGF